MASQVFPWARRRDGVLFEVAAHAKCREGSTIRQPLYFVRNADGGHFSLDPVAQLLRSFMK
ncbi:MAG: hypothetical protein WB460_02420 [Candidatus Acidiferrales bacterium]